MVQAKVVGRPPRIVVKAGMKFGELTIIQKVTSKKAGNSWRVQCSCGTRLTTRQHYLLKTQNPKTNCGCKTYAGANQYKREKVIWQMMNRRCLYEGHVSYKYYGGAGIQPCARWIETNPEGWNNFIADMGPAPTPQHTLERLNPFQGYAPFQTDGSRQCVWATMAEQGKNKRHHWIQRAKADEAARNKAAQEAKND